MRKYQWLGSVLLMGFVMIFGAHHSAYAHEGIPDGSSTQAVARAGLDRLGWDVTVISQVKERVTAANIDVWAKRIIDAAASMKVGENGQLTPIPLRDEFQRDSSAIINVLLSEGFLAVGDFIVSTEWKMPDGQQVETLGTVDDSGGYKFDPVLYFTPAETTTVEPDPVSGSQNRSGIRFQIRNLYGIITAEGVWDVKFTSDRCRISEPPDWIVQRACTSAPLWYAKCTEGNIKFCSPNPNCPECVKRELIGFETVSERSIRQQFTDSAILENLPIDQTSPENSRLQTFERTIPQDSGSNDIPIDQTLSAQKEQLEQPQLPGRETSKLDRIGTVSSEVSTEKTIGEEDCIKYVYQMAFDTGINDIEVEAGGSAELEGIELNLLIKINATNIGSSGKLGNSGVLCTDYGYPYLDIYPGEYSGGASAAEGDGAGVEIQKLRAQVAEAYLVNAPNECGAPTVEACTLKKGHDACTEAKRVAAELLGAQLKKNNLKDKCGRFVRTLKPCKRAKNCKDFDNKVN